MNFESLCLRIEEILILAHNQRIRFKKESSFMTSLLFVIAIIYEKKTLEIQNIAIK
jgi:hypothetical protein